MTNENDLFIEEMLQACMDEWEKNPKPRPTYASLVNEAVLANELAYQKKHKGTYGIKNVVALRCPGCSAPIKDIEKNKCEYCGTYLFFAKEDK